MRIGKIVGTVTLNRWHPSLAGARYKLAVPQSWENLYETSDETMPEAAVFDELGAGEGSIIALSEGREAAMPFYPDVKPIDSYNAAILDTLDYERPEPKPTAPPS